MQQERIPNNAIMTYTQCTVKLRPNFEKIAQLNCTSSVIVSPKDVMITL